MQGTYNGSAVLPLIEHAETGTNGHDLVDVPKSANTAPSRIEELYQRAISGAGAVPYAYDFIARNYIFMGEGIEELIGYKPEEITPKLWTDIIQESVMLGETGGLSKDEAARLIKAGEIKQWRCDMRIRTRAGKSRWIADASVQNLNEAGRPTSSVGILQDITERKQAETFAVTFSKLGQELVSATTLEGCARIIARVADDLFGWHAFYLHLYVPQKDEIMPVLSSDIVDGQRKYFTPKTNITPSDSARRVLKCGAELILKEGMEPGASTFGDSNRPSASIMRAPIRERARSTGVLAIHSYTAQAYNNKDLNILQTLADYCSGAFERIWSEERVKALNKKLVETSRQAGMAEVATSVLHNVGNVLNSVNVSSTIIADKVNKSKAANLGKAVELIEAHKADLASFLTSDPKGRELPAYLSSLSAHMLKERSQILEEIASLTHDIGHIKEIVDMQQNYARVSGVTEHLNVIDLVEDAIRLNEGAIERHKVTLVRDFKEPVPVTVDKHKVLQILVNLIRNAKYALDDGAPPEKLMTVRVAAHKDDRVQISVMDNGVGIPAENLVRIFGHGFTTRKEGHGFGLHSGALSAKELGGSLTVHSEGLGKGATFTLEFPCQPASASA